MPAQDKRQLNARVSAQLIRRLKLAALRANTPVCALVERAILDLLRKETDEHDTDGTQI